MTKKTALGQFYTTNYKRILDGMSQPVIKKIMEPFAGNCDLLQFIQERGSCEITCYDVDPAHVGDRAVVENVEQKVEQKDTLVDPPAYAGTFVLTNPPYLARNKALDKTIFDKYGENDLYKCFLRTLLQDPPAGGIVIIPLNFWSSIRKADVSLRRQFLKHFEIIRTNIFEERVFEDTSYTVCAIEFVKRRGQVAEQIAFYIYSYGDPIIMHFELNESTNWSIGGKIYRLPQGMATVDRLTRKNVESATGITNIKLFSIDNNASKMIRLEMTADRFVDTTAKLSERTFATLVIMPELSLDQQKVLVQKFNSCLRVMRKKYRSLFLTNYRESTSISRKRISFELVYSIVKYLLQR